MSRYVDGFVIPVPKAKLEAYRRMSRKAGIICFLPKPVPPDELCECVRSALAANRPGSSACAHRGGEEQPWPRALRQRHRLSESGSIGSRSMLRVAVLAPITTPES